MAKSDQELPGICMIAGLGICLTVVGVFIAAALDAHMLKVVKDIGTVLAAMVVFGSALIAYEGTTSKTRHDQKVDQREQEARRINSALRAENHAMSALHSVNQLYQHLRPELRAAMPTMVGVLIMPVMLSVVQIVNGSLD